MATLAPKLSFKEQMHQARERAILQTACDLLGAKSFDAMTMDDVAGGVGIAKASLYKHFGSKEELCCAAMVEVLHLVNDFITTLEPTLPPVAKLRAVVRWSLERQMAGEIPLLPSHNSSLRAVLMSNQDYAGSVERLSDTLGAWIVQAQAEGVLDPELPPLVVLYTLYARACDTVAGLLLESGLYQREDIIELVLRTCFDGLRSR